MFDKVEQFVIDSFTKTGKTEGNIEHLQNTVYWVKQLTNKYDEALLIAAIAHDIDRAFPDDRVKWTKLGIEASNVKHQQRCASIINAYLEQNNANQELVDKVTYLVAHHEIGGSAEANILKDADSLSFMDVLPKVFIKMFGRETFLKHLEHSYHRISTKKAKNIAKPLYEKAISLGNLH